MKVWLFEDLPICDTLPKPQTVFWWGNNWKPALHKLVRFHKSVHDDGLFRVSEVFVRYTLSDKHNSILQIKWYRVSWLSHEILPFHLESNQFLWWKFVKQTQSLGKIQCKGNYKFLVSNSENICLQKKTPSPPSAAQEILNNQNVKSKY